MHIEPGKPWQNGTNESFNGKFRDECLAMNWFYSRAHAKVIIETWRKQMTKGNPFRGNPFRDILIIPHSSLDYQTPAEFVAGWQKELITGARVSR